MHIVCFFLFNASNSDHELIKRKLLSVPDKRDIQNVQSSGSG